MKVFEFAKELEIETLALMDKIREWKLPVKSHMASLDEDLMNQIKEKLEEGRAPAKKKKAAKKKAAKKTAKKKTAKKATAARKKTAKKASGKSSTTKTVLVTRKKSGAETSTTLVVKKDASGEQKKVVSRKSTVIRRKALKTEEDMQAKSDATNEAAAAAADESATEGDSNEATTEARVPKKRTNIIGKMDLSKAKPPAGTQADRSSSRAPAGARNIRPGFYAAPTEAAVDPAQSAHDKDKRREKEKAKKAGAGGKEEEEQQFIASDFRKREIIFQPKKKRLVVSNKDFKKNQLTTPKASKRILKVHGSMNVGELAQAMGQKTPVIMKKLMGMGEMVNINSTLDIDTISLIAPEYGFEVSNILRTPEEMINASRVGDISADPITRPPVVTVMGHVDHGKTSLLDAIRKANVAAKEAGGITQHIGAYKVKLESGQEVTFIDTPGHEAFTAMRARGAKVTDVAIIVVAADDGVMPQTAEAINHAKAAEVPIIIAVNKMDKEGANVERIKQQMTEFEIVPEEWGGSHIFCPVSAIEKTGITELLEQILLVSEMEDLKANPKQSGSGIVVEARVEKGRGPVATLLVQNGVVKKGDYMVAGTVKGRVKAMTNDLGKMVKDAQPGDPVEVLGFDEAPLAGDTFDIVAKESQAEDVISERKRLVTEAESGKEKNMSMEAIFAKVKKDGAQELPIILKTDVSGSIEAIKGMLDKVSTEEVKVKVIHAAVGAISESDVLLASTSGGIIVGFNVRPDSMASQRSKERGVEIKTYTIVYNLIDEMKLAMSGLLSPDEVEKETGKAEIREVFSVPKAGNIGGCSVTEGKIHRNDKVRLVRDGKVVYQGDISSLRRFKDDVKEVGSGYECGIGIENYNDIKPGDVIEAYIIEEVAREL